MTKEARGPVGRLKFQIKVCSNLVHRLWVEGVKEELSEAWTYGVKHRYRSRQTKSAPNGDTGRQRGAIS